tara:strand:+ start:278 stop:826 length:549 start_codon:yes stop_codon:yes gene_type:complete
MKNTTQILTSLITICLLTYFVYIGSTTTKPEPEVKIINATGGIYLMDGEYKNREFELSNNGEVELIQNMIKEYNAMNIENTIAFFADTIMFKAMNGKKLNLTHQDLISSFNIIDSISWIAKSIIPLHIVDTDPSTGAIVHSIEKRYYKNGEIWEKELMEIFGINDSKITWCMQFGQDIPEDN